MDGTFDRVIEHFDWVADHDAGPRRWQSGFHRMLANYHRRHIPQESSVLEWGCGAGELLAALEVSRGLGLDISDNMIKKAQTRDLRNCEFRRANILSDQVHEKFDHIVLSFLTGYLPDIQLALRNLQTSCHCRTRLHLTSVNTLWLYPFKLASKMGMVMPQPPSNWLATSDLVNLLELSGWEVLSHSTELIVPFRIPLLGQLFNRVLVHFPLFRHLGTTVAVTARPINIKPRPGLSCSVVIPARNEAGNIKSALERIPLMGSSTEIIIVEGHSKDDTWAQIQAEIALYTGPARILALRQPGKGKWDAVRAGFEVATGDVLVIQDADLTAPPEDLPKFFEAISSGLAEFANGSRLVYPMEQHAMRFLNLVGNKAFALALSYILNQPVKDSLCGTKMVLRSDYERIFRRIKDLGDFDPFGDFNLLFGAALLQLRIRDIPVRYKDRTYGETNISRFRHGLLLLRMTAFGLFRVRWGSSAER